jgi:hypothetical protein
MKDFKIEGQVNFNFRADFFNVFNIQNYSYPDTNVPAQDSASGTITSTVTGVPRLIQLGAHLNF